MNLLSRISVTIGAALLSSTSILAQTTYAIDPAASTIKWTGSKVIGGSHYGTVKLASGTLRLNAGSLTDGAFVANMKSLTVDDLTGDTAEKLSGHLFSEDFFAISVHPTASFDITKVKPGSGNTANVTGQLTVKGKTSEVTFPVTYSVQKDGKLVASGTAVVDRTKHDVRYGSASFFNDLGDKAISDEFTLEVSLVAKRA